MLNVAHLAGGDERWRPSGSADRSRSGYEQQVSGIDSVNNRLVDVHCDFFCSAAVNRGSLSGTGGSGGTGSGRLSANLEHNRVGQMGEVTQGRAAADRAQRTANVRTHMTMHWQDCAHAEPVHTHTLHGGPKEHQFY